MHSTADILVIDDDPAMVRLLVELLRGRGFRLRVALDGKDGHCKALQGAPDLILLDVAMPEVDGHRLCRLLKDDPRTRDIPVIFLTGRDDPADKLEGFGAGGSDYVTKPFQADELVARINVHLNLRRRLRASLSMPPAPAPSPEEPVPESRNDHRVQQATAILRAELAEPPSLVELARRVGTNERLLTEQFRRRFGLPVFAWLREERHKRACELLLTTDLGIGAIAIEIGYGNAAAFTTAFRERYGMTPSAYRRSAGLAAASEEAPAASES
jgi:DNA-binding response OmpR family regulator